MVTRDWGLVIGEWGPAPRIRGTRLHVVAGRAYARIGDWENFYSRKGRKGVMGAGARISEWPVEISDW